MSCVINVVTINIVIVVLEYKMDLSLRKFRDVDNKIKIKDRINIKK